MYWLLMNPSVNRTDTLAFKELPFYWEEDRHIRNEPINNNIQHMVKIEEKTAGVVGSGGALEGTWLSSLKGHPLCLFSQ